MELKKSLQKFVDIFNNFEGNFGVAQLQNLIEIQEPFPLGKILRDYYGQLHLSNNPSIGQKMHLRLIPLENLTTAQAGWLWTTDKSGKQIENTNWRKNWVIIADRHGDAIFVDIEKDNGSVYGSIQQRNFLISDDLGLFFETIAECMILEKEKYDYEVMDEDFNTLDSFINEVVIIAEKKLGTDGKNGFMKFFFE